MKTVFTCFVLLCTALVMINCEVDMDAVMENVEICREKFGFTMDEVSVPDLPDELVCYEHCLMDRMEIIINGDQFNSEKFQELMLLLKTPEEVKAYMKAIDECITEMSVEVRDCESYTQMKECIKPKL